MDENIKIEGEPLGRYRISYWGISVGHYETAQEAVAGYESHHRVSRPIIDPKNKGRYAIHDGRTKELTISELRLRAKAEEKAAASCHQQPIAADRHE